MWSGRFVSTEACRFEFKSVLRPTRPPPLAAETNKCRIGSTPARTIWTVEAEIIGCLLAERLKERNAVQGTKEGVIFSSLAVSTSTQFLSERALAHL